MPDTGSSMPLGRMAEQAIAYYQPIVDLDSGRVCGAEALARFVCPDGTILAPGGIIEGIEQSPEHLDTFFRSFFRSIVGTVPPLLESHPDLYISLNIPPIILGSGRLRPILESFEMQRYARQLVCEITERQALTDLGRQALAVAHAMGVRIAIDDFGTGHSGLKQLIGLPLDILKIDKSQIDPLMVDPTADRLLRGVVALASALRVKVVAEGVEAPEQAFFLRAAGVDAGQGWLWSKAVPPEELGPLVAAGFPSQARWTPLR